MSEAAAGARASSDGSDDAPMLPPPLAKALGVGGEPKEYLQIEKLNEKLTSFEYSLRKASVSPASAKRERARQSLARQFGSEFAAFGLDAATVERVLEATKAYRKKEERLTSQIEKKLMAREGNAEDKYREHHKEIQFFVQMRNIDIHLIGQGPLWGWLSNLR